MVLKGVEDGKFFAALQRGVGGSVSPALASA